MSELVWVKSSYSGPAGGECVEIAVEWRESSYSDSGGGDCVEFATAPAAVHISDSKRMDGPALCLSPRSWSEFLDGLQPERG